MNSICGIMSATKECNIRANKIKQKNIVMLLQWKYLGQHNIKAKTCSLYSSVQGFLFKLWSCCHHFWWFGTIFIAGWTGYALLMWFLWTYANHVKATRFTGFKLSRNKLKALDFFYIYFKVLCRHFWSLTAPIPNQFQRWKKKAEQLL